MKLVSHDVRCGVVRDRVGRADHRRDPRNELGDGQRERAAATADVDLLDLVGASIARSRRADRGRGRAVDQGGRGHVSGRVDRRQHDDRRSVEQARPEADVAYQLAVVESAGQAAVVRVALVC